ncbi:MAG: carotenoid biosynthesis protein [Deltaproteobacteria bacterium]|nr:carotenoid biosynthesis protein [Deltaproteobacteria bacterium]
MVVLQLVAFAIVAFFVVVRALRASDARGFLTRMALLAVGSWIVEDTCIHAYGFYFYDAQWLVFVDQVPVTVVLIWPVVIQSAWDVAGHLLGARHPLVPLAGAAIVFADASMIEPIATHSGLWAWTEPGLFAVPPIGVLGWALYGGLCMAFLDHNRRAQRSGIRDLWVLALAPAGTHVLLLASWWGLMRWINVTIDPWPVVTVAWLVSLGLATWSLRVGARRRVPPVDMFMRVPAAIFFFVLLAQHCRDVPALIAYGIAFAPPYLSLTRFDRSSLGWSVRGAAPP